MKIAIMETGYWGLTAAVSLAYLGHEVVGVDVEEAEVAALRRGELPEVQVVFIAVGTSPLPDGSPDLSRGRSAAEAIGRHLGEGFTVVINESTVPVGSGDYAEVRYG
jgi:UDPglucose 6-dehydrogenase